MRYRRPRGVNDITYREVMLAALQGDLVVEEKKS